MEFSRISVNKDISAGLHQILMADDDNNPSFFGLPPPSYKDHSRSPRCEEDIRNAPPSYAANTSSKNISGADQITEWMNQNVVVKMGIGATRALGFVLGWAPE